MGVAAIGHRGALLDGAAPLYVQEIQAELDKAGIALAYTTVMTVPVRLHENGLLVREKESRRFLYSAAKRSGAAKGGALSNESSACIRPPVQRQMRISKVPSASSSVS